MNFFKEKIAPRNSLK